MTKVKFIAGERNDELYRLAKWHFARGTHASTIKKLVRERNQKFVEPVTDAEIADVITTAKTFAKSTKKPAAKTTRKRAA